jgi:Ner family transcriptional regulator
MPRKRWDRFAIKAEVHRRGTTLTRIATEAGLDPSACSAALIRRHFAGERALAQYLSLNPADLWPERYETSTSGGENSAAHARATRQNEREHSDMGAAA